ISEEEEDGVVSDRGALLLANPNLHLDGFTKSLAMTVLSEIGDKTFFAAAVKLILAMRHPRKLVLAGCLAALIVMTILSVSLGWIAPNLMRRSRQQRRDLIASDEEATSHLRRLAREVGNRSGSSRESGVESLVRVKNWQKSKLNWLVKLSKTLLIHFMDGVFSKFLYTPQNADWKAETGSNKGNTKGSDDLKKQQRPFLTQFFSPIFLKVMIATIGLASDENPFGVVLGGIVYALYPPFPFCGSWTSIVHHSSSNRRKEPGVADIGKDGNEHPWIFVTTYRKLIRELMSGYYYFDHRLHSPVAYSSWYLASNPS
ncbi:hypothetical protein GW17_00017819, partial [Ensete ventricosum]